MIQANPHYAELPESYLFVTIARKVREYQQAHPEREIIRMGIGDVVLPLAPTVAKALADAALAMATPEGFRGYGPEQGYAELRQAIAQVEYGQRGVVVDPDEIFVSDGAKCDTGHFQELFARGIRIGIPDPVYPVYRDSNIMAGRGSNITLLPARREDGMVALPPDRPLDLVYLCSPNNPTGAVLTRVQLQAWVEWARRHRALLLFDAAYAAYVVNPDLPQSIYEIPGARECAVEFRSLSKSAGFTGVRCAFTVVPKELKVASDSSEVRLWDLWMRRQSTLFNGVSWPVQAAALAVYSEAGQRETAEQVAIYRRNAHRLAEFFRAKGLEVYGGDNAPYVWVYLGGDSWEIFDRFLQEAAVVVTPGSGFGAQGQGFVRFSAFQTPSRVEEAIERLSRVL